MRPQSVFLAVTAAMCGALSAAVPAGPRFPAPDGRFSLQLAAEREWMVLLTEGDRFRDQWWVLLFHFRVSNRPIDPNAGTPARAVWSADSRRVLLLTRDTGGAGLSILPGGEELYLLFDTKRWEGVIGPAPAEVKAAGLDLSPGGDTRAPVAE